MTTSLPTTRLGWTYMHLTRVGFGAWAVGGEAGRTPGATRMMPSRSLRSATRWSPGVNWIDTAAVYGLGHLEEVVAVALAACPRRTGRRYVFTKGGLVWDPARRSAASRRVGDPASLRAEVEASLRRLKVSDLYQMHWPAEDGTTVEDYCRPSATSGAKARSERRGCSNHDVCELEAAQDIGNVDAIQPPFSLIHRDNAADDVLPWRHQHETGVIVYSPMASGLLTGAFTAARAASRIRPLAGQPPRLPAQPALTANLALAAALRPVAERHGVTPAAVAIAWTLSFPGVTGAIPGPAAPPGRRLAARGETGTEGRRPGRHRRRHPRHRRRHLHLVHPLCRPVPDLPGSRLTRSTAELRLGRDPALSDGGRCCCRRSQLARPAAGGPVARWPRRQGAVRRPGPRRTQDPRDLPGLLRAEARARPPRRARRTRPRDRRRLVHRRGRAR